jgi:ankyrin repeat protein
MELLDLSNDVIRQIMIYYIDNSKINQNKIKFIGSHQLNEINEDINIITPPLYIACKCKETNNALPLISREDCNYVSIGGYTSLICACINEMSDIALKILDFECKPNQVNNAGYTALIYACRYEMSDVALKILNLDGNGKPDQVNGYGETALIWACENDMDCVALEILDFECSINQSNRFSDTALKCAQKNDMVDVVTKILHK